MSTVTKQLEVEIYDTYYQRNPDGDARYNLWPDVSECESLEELQGILKLVQQGVYDYA